MRNYPIMVWKEIQLISSTGGILPPFPGSGPPQAHEDEHRIFSALLDGIDYANPVMCELGSYWALWSLVFRKRFPLGRSILVDADLSKLAVGIKNFELNGLASTPHWAAVGNPLPPNVAGMTFKQLQEINRADYFDVLHMDIQGAELPFCYQLEADSSFDQIGAVYIATHSPQIHSEILRVLTRAGLTITVNQGPSVGGVDGTVTAISKTSRRRRT